VVIFALMYCIGPCLFVICIGEESYVVPPNPMWLVMTHPFSPHFKIGFSFMDIVNFLLMLVTLHHVDHL
jgi:hypothetical protein